MSIRRSIGYSFIEPMVKQGLSPTRIYNMLKQAGVGYNRQQTFRDIAVFTGRHKNETQVRSLTSNKVVPVNYMQEAELRRPYKYRVYGETHYWDEETGDEIIREGSFYTDDLAKKQDWESQYIDHVRKSPSLEDVEIMSFHIKGVDHNEGFGY